MSIEDQLKAVPPPLKKTKKNKLKAVVQKKERITEKLQEALKAKREAEKEINKVKKAEAALEGKTSVVTPEEIMSLPPSVRPQLTDREIAFMPNEGPQTEFLAATEKEVFYGGARGGGKSYSLLVDPLRYCNREAHRALILRRTMPELRDLINHSQKLYPKAYPGARWREQEKEWRFPSGARIEFGYAETRQDALRYQGQAYSWIGVDELPQYPDPGIWNDLRGSLRTVDPQVPEFMRATGNPGNVGSAWIKEMFIDPAPWGEAFNVTIDTSKGPKTITRRFIPAKLEDNPYLTQTDSYFIMLSSLPEIQRRQWLEGDWDAWDGAAFPEFKTDVHVVKPFDIPHEWPRFRACDWGYSSPACCLWFAVDYDGNLYVYRELYVNGKTGVKFAADRFAQRVREMERGEKILYGILDSSVWAKRGDVGPGIVETMQQNGCFWRPSDRSPQSRKNGKLEIHRRLALREVGDGAVKPSLLIFNTCRNLIRDLPTLPLDENDPEDVDTDANDHSYDALRYGCMSRPINPQRLTWMSQAIEQERYSPADKVFGY